LSLNTEIPYRDIAYQIIGAAMRFHSRRAPGLREIHYQRALAVEISGVNLRISEEHPVEIFDAEQWIGRKRLEYKRILPPILIDGWQDRIQRFLWRPKGFNEHPPLDKPNPG
jgi:hypothetical protein